MRLLERKADGRFCLTDDIPNKDIARYPYAILSHRWGETGQEVTYEDVIQGTGQQKAGYEKIRFCQSQAAKDGLKYSWIDSCCIRKSSDSELTEAINSMYSWYSRAARCYVYLPDVSVAQSPGSTDLSTWHEPFRRSEWFCRGWTLQELLAPNWVGFFSRERVLLGDRSSLCRIINEITGIPAPALNGAPPTQFPVDERFSWADNRYTTRDEDWAYCLMGIFGVKMSVRYSEGREEAVARLKRKIARASKKRRRDSVSTEPDDPVFQRRHAAESDPSGSPAPVASAKANLLDSLRFDQIDDRFVNIRPRHALTCNWLLTTSEFANWLNGDAGSKHQEVLWLKGKPGSGKSTLMKFALMELKKQLPDSVVLSFFFNARGAELEKTTVGLFRSLLVQLLETAMDDRQARQVMEMSNIHSGSKTKWNRRSLEDLLAHSISHTRRRSFTFVIDALDECHEDDIRDMVAFFERLVTDSVAEDVSCRVLFASRHYPHVTIRRSVEIILQDQEGHSSDINKYLLSEMRGLGGQQADALREEICQRASGIFMWVVLVVQILNKISDHGQIRQMRKRLSELPNDLNELFRDILTRDSDNMEEMKLCLQWVLYATRPMKREELYFAIWSGLQPGELMRHDPDEDSPEAMTKFILSSSKGLAEVTKSRDHIIQFIHESVRDFLLKDHGLCQIWPDLAPNGMGIGNDLLKNCCWNQIRVCERAPEITDITLPPAKSPEAIQLRRQTLMEHPFLGYAVHGIFTHADLAEGAGISQKRFLEEISVRDWVHHNNLLEKHEIRRLPADLKYLFVVLRCHNLLRLLKHYNPGPHERIGRYRNPVFAAIAKDDMQAFDILARLDNELGNGPLSFPYPCKRYTSFLIEHGSATSIARFFSTYDVEIEARLKRDGTLLMWAIENGYEQVVDALLNNDVNVNPEHAYQTPLALASLHGHQSLITRLLDSGADINADSSPYGSALQTASLYGHYMIVKTLLDRGADVNASSGPLGNALTACVYGCDDFVPMLLERGGNYGSALQAVSQDKRHMIIKLLLDRGADVNASAGEFGNALQGACAHARRETVQLLLDRGADVNAEGGKHGSALHIASKRSHPLIVSTLLDNGANVNTTTADLGSPLQAALLHDKLWLPEQHHTVIKLLLDRGADVNTQGGQFCNALQSASVAQDLSSVRLLLNRGAAINAPGGHYGSALQAAAARGAYDVVDLLLRQGANVEPFDATYRSALQAASECDHEAMVRLLLDAGADVDLLSGEHGSALHAAAFRGHQRTVRLLLDAGAEVNSDVMSYPSAITLASREGHTAVVEMLINAGAKVNLYNPAHKSALQAASHGGHEATVRLLLDAGAEVNTDGMSHPSAITLALLQCHTAVVEMLLEAGASKPDGML